jgi:hypothetical protein
VTTTQHEVDLRVVVEVTDELAVREHAFMILRQRVETDSPLAQVLTEQITSSVDGAVRFLLSWQITGGEGLFGAPGLKVKQATFPPAAS